MEDIFLSIIAKMAENAIDPILHHARYLCCSNNFVENLQNAKEELELIQESVKEAVRVAMSKLEQIDIAVQKWLKDVEIVLEEVQVLERRISKVSKCYFKGRCQYFLAKEIARKTEKMTQLNCNSKFGSFSRITKYYSTKDYVPFESTMSAYNNLLKALKDKNVGMIGLVGMEGSGKTTLVKEVVKKVVELKLVEELVMITVSLTPNFRRIQAQIANILGIKLEESDKGRAQRLSQRLSEGATLLILDDVWEKLNFESLGIPFSENNKGCRVLLTTRSIEVCYSMGCQSIIKLNLLTSEEAWTLFTLHANITDDSPNVLKVVARKIVKKCNGLPSTIVMVGSTLRGGNFEKWKSALSRLEDSKPLDIHESLTSPFIFVKLSCDNLKNQLAKSLLLLCSIFPKDHEIHLEDLFRFGRGLGLIETFGTMEKARRKMHVAVNILLDSCLLLHVNNKRVKMYDLVRDAALRISLESSQAILASTGMDPRMLAEDEIIKDKKAISLWDLKNVQFLDDDQLNCPTLELLLLHSPKVGFQVSSACLERLEMLKILAFLTCEYKWELSRLERNSPSQYTLSLPKSIESLKSLHTLCLRGYKLGDISILKSLQELEILDLRGSSFEELPNGIVALKKLKLLDLYNCWIEKSNAYNVIGGCLQLEELYLYLFPSEEDFPHNVPFSRLQRYVIIHDPSKRNLSFYFEEHRISRALCINGLKVSTESFISLPIKDLFVRVEYLHLSHLGGGYKNVIPSMDDQGMNQLIVLILEYCPDLECLFDSTIINNSNVDMFQIEAVFSNLRVLSLDGLHSLQEVFSDHSMGCSMKNLERLIIENCIQLYRISFPSTSKLCSLKQMRIRRCPMLTSLFMPSITQTLVLLEVLEISQCSELKHIIEEAEKGNISGQSHSSLTLPKLRILEIEGCKRLKYIFPVHLPGGLVSLKRMRIQNCHELKYVFGTEKDHHISVVYQYLYPHLPNLDTLVLDFLPKLVNIWPDYCRPRLLNLRKLRCTECPRLSNSSWRKVVINSDLHQDTTAMEKEIPVKAVLKYGSLNLSDIGVKVLFQFQIKEPGSIPLNLDLFKLKLWNLPKLKSIWNGPTNFLSLKLLNCIYVDGCPKLITIFSPTILRSLPLLGELQILNCEELEQIYDSGDVQELKSLYTCSQQVCFPKLTDIRVQKCNKLKCLFYNFVAGHLPSLITLKIEECSQLEKIFAFEREASDDGQEGNGKDGEDGEQLLLQNLRNITLTSLPNFKEIHYKFKLKDHVERIIKDCPKYYLSLYLHLESKFPITRWY